MIFLRKPAPVLDDKLFGIKSWPDSKLPQQPILKENLLVAAFPGLQTLAGESLDIVAFASAGTTYRAVGWFLVHS